MVGSVGVRWGIGCGVVKSRTEVEEGVGVVTQKERLRVEEKKRGFAGNRTRATSTLSKYYTT